eukprot:Awhi_evm1s12528
MKYKLKDECASRGKVFDRYHGQNPKMLAVDRIVANTQEQMVPFLVSLWMQAILINPEKAGFLGYIYIFLRLGYRFLMPKDLVNTFNLK